MPAAKILLAISHYFEFGGLQRDMVRVARLLNARGAHTHILCGGWAGDIPPDLSVEVVTLTAFTNHAKIRQLSEHVATRRSQFDATIGFVKMPHLDFYFGGDHCFRERMLQEKPRWQHYLPRYRVFNAMEEAVFGAFSKTESFLIAAEQKAAYQRQWHTPENRAHLLPGGLNKAFMDAGRPDEAGKKALRDELKLNDHERVIVHVGSDFKRKGVDRILRAFASLPNELQRTHRVVIVGSGDASEMLKLSDELAIRDRVIFTGGRRDVPAFYAIAHTMMHPAYIENTGGIILESLYMGVPVICTKECGYSNHVVAADGGLVTDSPFDQTQLNAHLLTMLQSPQHAQWQHHARRYCEHAPVTGMIEAIADRMLAFVAQNHC